MNDQCHRLGKLLTWAVLIFGGLALVLGVVFTAMYILEAVIGRVGEPDQSLLFWYLPILFLGLIGITVGFALIRWGVRRRNGIHLRIDQ